MTIFINFTEPTISQSISTGGICGILSLPLSLLIDNYHSPLPLIVEYHHITLLFASLLTVAIVFWHNLCSTIGISSFLFSIGLFIPMAAVIGISSVIHWVQLALFGQQDKFSILFWKRHFIRASLGLIPIVLLHLITIQK